MTISHSAYCIQMTMVAIDENNLDTLVERGINARIAAVDPAKSNKLIDDELEAGYAEGTLVEPTEDVAAEWLASGMATCYHDCI